MCRTIEELCENASAKAFEEGRAEGREEGRAKNSIELAQKALQSKMMSPTQAADFFGLPLEKVLSLC